MTADDLRALPPRKSGWVLLDAARVKAFADVTGDWQFVHLDEARAREETPFGGAIAHGFLTLSMLSAMSQDVTGDMPELATSVNYGFDRIRFVTPVPVGSRIRGSFAVAGVDEGEGWLNIHWDVELEIEGKDQPALVANWITGTALTDVADGSEYRGPPGFEGEPDYSFAHHLGMKMHDWSDGLACFALPAAPFLMNLHGGVHAPLLDTVMGYAGCWTGDPERPQMCLTLTLNVQYLVATQGRDADRRGNQDRRRAQHLLRRGDHRGRHGRGDCQGYGDVPVSAGVKCPIVGHDSRLAKSTACWDGSTYS